MSTPAPRSAPQRSPAALGARLRAPRPAEVTAAIAAVRAHLPPSPLVATTIPTPLGDVDAWLKLETAQPTGSFKVRGALGALAGLAPGARAVSASAGNHALGMAWASSCLGVPVTVVTPETASAAKLAAIDSYTRLPAGQVNLVLRGHSYEEAESCARGMVATDPTAVYVSAYSDHAVMAGQSSIGAELDDACPPDESLCVVAPLGGGGLASGLVTWASGRPRTGVVGVEATASPAVSSAIAAGRIIRVGVSTTLADGLAGNLEEGCPTPSILASAAQAGTFSAASVDEAEIAGAMRWLFSTHGLVAEGAGAAGVAAVIAGKVHRAGRLVVVVTGRNVTAGTYSSALCPDAAPLRARDGGAFG